MGQSYIHQVNATDPDGDAISLTATGLTGYNLPSFVTFTDNGNGTAQLHLAPTQADRGDYSLILKASDGNAFTEYTFIVSVPVANKENPFF